MTHGECAHFALSTVHVVFVLQTPFVHVPLHVTPHPPQLASSLPMVSTQALEQQVWAPHAVPHEPQLFPSLDVSTHAFEQQAWFVPVQVPPHAPVSGAASFPPLDASVPPPPESFGGVFASTGAAPSCGTPASVTTSSPEPSVPVAHPLAAARRTTPPHETAPTTRMMPSPHAGYRTST